MDPAKNSKLETRLPRLPRDLADLQMGGCMVETAMD